MLLRRGAWRALRFPVAVVTGGIVALMVLEHQARVTNLITRLDWEARVGDVSRMRDAAAENIVRNETSEPQHATHKRRLGAWVRAVREAVRRINANKSDYMHYFIDYHGRTDPEVAALKVEDLREGRLVVCDPAPIPPDEMQRTYDWLKSWGMLEETASPLDLVNMHVQSSAHSAAGYQA